MYSHHEMVPRFHKPRIFFLSPYVQENVHPSVVELRPRETAASSAKIAERVYVLQFLHFQAHYYNKAQDTG
jgi:hypothetical protein